MMAKCPQTVIDRRHAWLPAGGAESIDDNLLIGILTRPSCCRSHPRRTAPADAFSSLAPSARAMREARSGTPSAQLKTRAEGRAEGRDEAVLAAKRRVSSSGA